MGAPRRNRRTYDKPKEMWNLQRISADNALLEEYGLKNMRELWKVQSEVSRIRGNVRSLLSGTGSASVKDAMLGRLSRYGIAGSGASLDDILDLKESAVLARRLQSVVFRRGLAKSMKQARQLIVHGFISVNGRRVSVPSYLVASSEEAHIGYYKPITIENLKKEGVPEPVPAAAAAETPGTKDEGADGK
jgi:small subunit ribosomal protein S4